MEDDDDYILYGTPVPEDAETLKKIATRELQVRDEKGRQRLHGAFTGGFSAGYFNTVGTKEGWAPSSFISSRKNKSAEYKKQQPEDFMDDEDFGEFGIASRKIHMTLSFQNESSEPPRKRVFYTKDSVIPGEAPLKDIIRPVKESIGIKMLKKLGWKQGQGIGPRVKKSSVQYGFSQFPGGENVKEEDEFMLKYTFAPEDIIAPSYEIKDNFFGLGYIGLSKQSVLNAPVDIFSPTSTKSWLAKDKKSISITGQAFGVGAFEDEDEDIYSKDDMSQYNFSEFAHPDKEEILDNIDMHKSKVSAHDIIKDLHIASNPLPPKKRYSPPLLPKNFKPIHLSMPKPLNEKKSHHQLTASERSSLLGENKFSLSEPTSEKQKDWKEKFKISPSLNQSSTQFKPFVHDAEKQKRYEQFIKLVELGETEKMIQPSSMTEWEKFQEIEEFSKAVNFYKPKASCLSNRFVSKSHLNLEHEIQEALQNNKEETKEKIKRLAIGSINSQSKEWHPASLLCKRFNVPNPFPNIDCNSGSQSQQTKKKYLFAELFENITPINITRTPNSNSLEDETTRPSKNEKIEELSEKQSTSYNDLHNATELSSFENKRPPLDLFKEIFGNSSSEDEEETDTKSENEHGSSSNPLSMMEKNDLQKEVSSGINEQTFNNKKKAFGVFANLDLDALKQCNDSNNSSIEILAEKSPIASPESPSDYSNLNTQKQDNNGESHKRIKKNDSDSSIEDLNEESPDSSDFYGPELPPGYTTSNMSSETTPVYSKNKSYKHKHHKHKKGKKKKKYSRKDLEKFALNVNPLSVIEKIKKLQ